MTRDTMSHPSRTDAYFHPEAGTVYIRQFSPRTDGGWAFPEGKPFFCAGGFYATEEDAWVDFCERWDRSKYEAECIDEITYRAQYAHACGYHE